MGSEKQSDDCVKACIKVAACVCGKDGIISSVEEEEMYRLFVERYPEHDEGLFECALTEFFDSDNQIEHYLALIEDGEYREFALELAEESARADGLDPLENIALRKVHLIWGGHQDA